MRSVCGGDRQRRLKIGGGSDWSTGRVARGDQTRRTAVHAYSLGNRDLSATYQSYLELVQSYRAEGEGFEPSRRCNRLRDFQSRALGQTMRPFQRPRSAAERVGFEPTEAQHLTAFRERHLQPLGHLSTADCSKAVYRWARRDRYQLAKAECGTRTIFRFELAGWRMVP